jgi:hypothetical protein
MLNMKEYLLLELELFVLKLGVHIWCLTESDSSLAFSNFSSLIMNNAEGVAGKVFQEGRGIRKISLLQVFLIQNSIFNGLFNDLR